MEGAREGLRLMGLETEVGRSSLSGVPRGRAVSGSARV